MRLPREAPQVETLLPALDPERIPAVFDRISAVSLRDKYLHWDEITHRKSPEGLTHEEWWLALKWARAGQAQIVPLTDADGKQFTFSVPDQAQRILHELALRAGGTIGAPDLVTSPATKHEYLVRNLMEEGIASSLLEGASTTREKAKELIRTKTKPRTEGETMAINNYRAMQYISTLGKVELTPNLVHRVHGILTEGTMKPEDVGRKRRSDEPVSVIDARDNQILHAPPPAEELDERMEQLCKFANDVSSKRFVHPVVRSIILHFWLAYDHPFKDGNGRCARALFYWSMLQHDYWLCQYFSISHIIRKAPAKYARAFLYTETDGNDITYFILHQLGVIERAIAELNEYLDRKAAARKSLERRIKQSSVFNERQLDLIEHALRHPDATYTIRQHQAAAGIVYETARTDLLDLAGKGLLTQRKSGKTFRFSPADDIEARLGDF